MKKHDLEKEQEVKYRAYKFSISLIKFISSLPKKSNLSILTNQLLRSGTSIGANIVEAQAARSKKDFANFYQIALKSANESRYWLCLLRDGFEIKDEKVKILLKEASSIANILAASLLTLKGKRK